MQLAAERTDVQSVVPPLHGSRIPPENASPFALDYRIITV